MKCRWCGVTDKTYPYWRNHYCCDKRNCQRKDRGEQRGYKLIKKGGEKN